MLPADQVLAVYGFASPDGLPSGNTTNISVSAVCPSPIIVDPEKVGFGWGVFTVLEEQVGTNWFLKDKDLMGYGLWPTIGGFVCSRRGGFPIDPARGGGSLHPV